jgi:hypothetical protein
LVSSLTAAAVLFVELELPARVVRNSLWKTRYRVGTARNYCPELITSVCYSGVHGTAVLRVVVDVMSLVMKRETVLLSFLGTREEGLAFEGFRLIMLVLALERI